MNKQKTNHFENSSCEESFVNTFVPGKVDLITQSRRKYEVVQVPVTQIVRVGHLFVKMFIILIRITVLYSF